MYGEEIGEPIFLAVEKCDLEKLIDVVFLLRLKGLHNVFEERRNESVNKLRDSLIKHKPFECRRARQIRGFIAVETPFYVR